MGRNEQKVRVIEYDLGNGRFRKKEAAEDWSSEGKYGYQRDHLHQHHRIHH